MTHRAETILEAVKTRLSGLTITGPRVERARVWEVEDVPALSIERGDDSPTETGRRFGFQDRGIDVAITAYVKTTGNPETALHAIAAQVYAAMFANVTQGLGYVMDTHWIGDSKPEKSTETETRTATMQMVYRITYRHSITSTES